MISTKIRKNVVKKVKNAKFQNLINKTKRKSIIKTQSNIKDSDTIKNIIQKFIKIIVRIIAILTKALNQIFHIINQIIRALNQNWMNQKLVMDLLF